MIYLLILVFVEFEIKDDSVSLHFILFLLCLVPTFLYLLKTGLKDSDFALPKFKGFKFSRFVKNGLVWVIALIFISGLILTVFTHTDVSSDEATVLFYGHNMLGSWDIPEYGKYGRDAVGDRKSVV